MSNAKKMDLMVKLANAKNALQAVRTAKSILEFTEFVSYKDYLESASYKLSGAEFKLERDVEFLQNLFDSTYVSFIPATEQQRAEEEEKNFPRHFSSLEQPEVY